jgi:hypothetical protein
MPKITVPWKQVQSLVGDVTRGLGEKQTVTLTSPASTNAISDKPWEGFAEATSSSTYSSIPAVVAVEEKMERDDTGTNVSVQQIKAVIGGGDLSVVPDIGWTISDDKAGVTYSVKKVRKIQPGRDILVYVVEGMA